MVAASYITYQSREGRTVSRLVTGVDVFVNFALGHPYLGCRETPCEGAWKALTSIIWRPKERNCNVFFLSAWVGKKNGLQPEEDIIKTEGTLL